MKRPRAVLKLQGIEATGAAALLLTTEQVRQAMGALLGITEVVVEVDSDDAATPSESSKAQSESTA